MAAGIIVAILVGLVVAWWLQGRRIRSVGGIAQVRSGDRDIERAMATARERFPEFVARLRDPQPGDEHFAVKVGVREDDQVEHLWLSDVQVDGEWIEGRIGNDPGLVKLKLGDPWRGPISQLSDWTYLSAGRMQGNFTLRAMLPRMPRRDREQARAMLEEHWDTRELVHRPWPPGAAQPGLPRSSELSTGDPALMAGVQAHLDARFGAGATVFHEILSPYAHLDLYPYPATAERRFHVVGTTGMAEQAQQPPDGMAAPSHVELLLALPADWPLDRECWADERHYWPLRWLKRVARYPYESGHWLGEGHVLLHGEPATPIHPAFPYDSVLLCAPPFLPADAQRLRLADGRTVRFLCLYFLDPAQRRSLESDAGPEACAALVAQRASV